MIALFLIGCGGEATSTPEPAPVPEKPAELSNVQKALAVAKAIDADPSAADAALKAAGLTEAEYRELLYAIAQDPAQSKEFASGR